MLKQNDVVAVEARLSGTEAAALLESGLVRLLQIAAELRGAARRSDLEVVMAAAALLGPTVTQCRQAKAVASNDASPRQAESAARIRKTALQIHEVLAECEAILTAAQQGVAAEMKRIQQGKRALVLTRGRGQGRAAGRVLSG